MGFPLLLLWQPLRRAAWCQERCGAVRWAACWGGCADITGRWRGRESGETAEGRELLREGAPGEVRDPHGGGAGGGSLGGCGLRACLGILLALCWCGVALGQRRCHTMP